MKNLSKDKLLIELKNNSISAFENICLQYMKPLFQYCYNFIRDTGYTEEVVQDILLALWNYRERIDVKGSIDALIFTIAKHHAINAFKKVVNSSIYEDYVNYNDSLASIEFDPIEYEEFIQQINHAIAKLPKKQQHIIKLSKFNGLSNGEIADLLDISEKTVRNQLSMGLSDLKKYLSTLK